MIQINAGFVHGAADHVIADISGAGEKIAEIAGIHGSHGGYCVALDTGDLYQTTDWVAGKTQVVFHCHFSGILYLIQILFIQFSQSGSGHRAGSANLGLASAFCTGNGGIALGKAANNAGSSKAPDDLFIGISPGILGIFQHCRQNAAGTAGWGGDDGAVVCILLCYGIGVGCDLLELQQGRDILFRRLFV